MFSGERRRHVDRENRETTAPQWVGQAALAGLMVLAAGCLTPRTDPGPTHTYELRLDAQHRDVEARPSNLTGPILLVSLPQSDPGFETPRMVFLKRPYELEYYSLNQWADTPARMIAPLLVEALSRKGNWKAVMPMPASIRGDYRLDTSSLVLQQEFLQQVSRVRIRAWTQLIDLRESRIVGTRLFDVAEDASSNDAYGGVLAANRAVATMLDQVGSWLQGCLRQAQECFQ